jgi:hypothetical protein
MRTAHTPPDAAAAEERFLADLRERVAWQAEEAARLRAQERPVAALDPLDADALERLVHAHPHALRNAEWRCFLADLRFLVDADGRLPASLERLVRVVFADLLER